MLSKLFGSNSRVKILKAFLFHPDERYYIRQLSRDLDLQVNSVRRELENLEEFGLLISESSNGSEKDGDSEGGQERKYYRVDKSFPLFEDIKGLIVKSQLFHKDDFSKDLLKAGNIKLLVLTGVFVNNFNSPTDVLIVGKINKDKLVEVIGNLENNLGREVNYTLLTAAEFKYRRDIADIFLYDLLDKEKIIIIDEIGIS
jgi:hypothetical protein